MSNHAKLFEPENAETSQIRCHCENEEAPYWTGLQIVTTLKTWIKTNKSGIVCNITWLFKQIFTDINFIFLIIFFIIY